MSVRLLTVLLLLLIFFGELNAQTSLNETSKRKYDGKWYIGSIRNPSPDSIVYSQIVLDSSEKVKWINVCKFIVNDTTFYKSGGCFLPLHVNIDTCLSDSLDKLAYSTCKLSGFKYDDNIRFQIEKSSELSVLYHSNIDRTIDVFKFQTICEKGNPIIELMFFTRNIGLAIYHYPYYDEIFYLTRADSL